MQGLNIIFLVNKNTSKKSIVICDLRYLILIFTFFWSAHRFRLVVGLDLWLMMAMEFLTWFLMTTRFSSIFLPRFHQNRQTLRDLSDYCLKAWQK